MARISDTYKAVDEEYRAQASLPLPEAAVVLDTRQRDDDPIPLLAHLNTELADLAAEMRSRNVVHWSHLRDCIALLRLDAISSELPLQHDTDFLLTSPSGMEQALPGVELLTGVLSSDFVERVRTARLNAPGAVESVSAMGGVKQSTVRVFLLADMREADSLARAATYAHWLKAWSEQEHGRSRHNRDERIHTVILCLNALASYQDVLLATLVPESAVDTVILLQKYTDDDAAIGETAQLAKAELLLYTLILRWPTVLWKRIDDPVEMHPRFIEAAKTLPWPTYLIGLAAFEYSSRWSARWLDYSVTGAILKTLNNAEAIEQERPYLASTVHKWLDAWQRELRAVVPDMLTARIAELQGLAFLGGSTRSAGFTRGKLRAEPGKLTALRARVKALYTGTDAPTLQVAIENGPSAVLDQLRRHAERSGDSEHAELGEDVAGDNHDVLEEPYSRLVVLKQQLERFLGLHFEDAEGAVPRGLVQLAVFQAHAQQTIAAIAQQQLKLSEYQQQLEQAAQAASAEMASRFKTWRLPFAGKLFRSTAISWMVAIAILVVLLSFINWQTLFADLPFAFLLSPVQSIIAWIVRVIVVLLVLAGEWLYLARRNRSMRRLCRVIEKRLDGIIAQQLATAGDVIAARVGLALVKQADLYTQNKMGSPYEERLQAFAQVCRRAQERTDLQQSLAETRLGVDSHENMPPPIWAASPDGHTNAECIDWSRIEEAFLETCRALPSNPMLNLLVEMLLRQLGTERPRAMLDDIWQQQRWIKGKDKEARFQTIGALLVALLLAAPVNQPSQTYQAELLSALQEYTELKILYIEERAMPAGDAIELQTVVKDAMLAQARGSQRAPSKGYLSDRLSAGYAARTQSAVGSAGRNKTFQSEQQGISALISWVNDQHERIPQLRETFASGDLLEHLMLSRMQPSLILDALYEQGTLLGYPDEISGEDTYYVFAAQGNELAYSMFVEAIDKVDGRRVQVMAFPDREKLIYLRIHRALQFFSQDDGAAEKG